MDFAIREAAPDDAAAIAHVQVSSWRTTYPGIVPDAYLAELNEDKFRQHWHQHLSAGELLLFVAEDARGVFGFITGGRLREPIEDYDAELYAIYLLADRQARGAGRGLTRTLAASLKAAGFISMVVWALEQNPAVGFYQRLGAAPVLRKTIQIGGADLLDLALGWPDLDRLTP